MQNLPSMGVGKPALAFGAALSALAMTDIPAYGDFVPLTAVPSVQPFGGAASAGSNILLSNVTFGGIGSFYQFNDNLGKTLRPGPQAFDWLGGPVATGSPITANMPFGTQAGIGAGGSGIQMFAFRTTANQVGWIQMNLGGLNGAIAYLAAGYNDTPGQGIFAGTSQVVPEPSSFALAGLAALAAGAGYIRKRRKAKAAA